jgi:glutaminase
MSTQYTSKEKEIFRKISKGCKTITSNDLVAFLTRNGFLSDDPRWTELYSQINQYKDITESSFLDLMRSKLFDIDKTIEKGNIIPDFETFYKEINLIFENVRNLNDLGKADYPKRVSNPHSFGFSICSIDGQRFNQGDSDEKFCIKSCANPLIYAIALEDHGQEKVHKLVGKEPSGKAYHAVTFTDQNIPYNPMINAGAIVLSSLLEKDYSGSKFFSILNWWERAVGGRKVDFNYTNFLFEKANDTKNHALGFFMKDNEVLQEDSDLFKVLEFYFKCGCIELDCNSLAIIAGTLANGGICPLTNERVFSTSTTTAVLTLMLSCGLYEESGQFAFAVGTPACSGTNGAFMVVIPGVCGYCVYSPRINKYSNSIKAIEISKLIGGKFKYHAFDGNDKLDWAKKKSLDVVQFFYACHDGDIMIVRKMVKKGMNVNIKDYDDRTPLHIAASEGNIEIVKFLLACGADREFRDRFGYRALDDARRIKNRAIEELLT